MKFQRKQSRLDEPDVVREMNAEKRMEHSGIAVQGCRVSLLRKQIRHQLVKLGFVPNIDGLEYAVELRIVRVG